MDIDYDAGGLPGFKQPKKRGPKRVGGVAKKRSPTKTLRGQIARTLRAKQKQNRQAYIAAGKKFRRLNFRYKRQLKELYPNLYQGKGDNLNNDI